MGALFPLEAVNIRPLLERRQLGLGNPCGFRVRIGLQQLFQGLARRLGILEFHLTVGDGQGRFGRAGMQGVVVMTERKLAMAFL